MWSYRLNGRISQVGKVGLPPLSESAFQVPLYS